MTREKVEHILDTSVTYLLYAMIFFTPISTAIIEIAFSLAAVMFVIKKILRPDFKFLKDYIHLFILLFIIFNALSLINSGVYLNKSLSALFLKWCKYIFIFIVTENTLSSRRRLKNTMLIIIVISTSVGIDVFFQHFMGIDFFRNRPSAYGQVTAAFKTRNSLGAYLVPILLLVIALVFQPMYKRYKLHIFFLMVLLAASLILTFSRAAWFGFFIGLILMVIVSKKIKKYIRIFGILIFLLLLIPNILERLVYTLVPGIGDADRISLAITAFKMIRENPILGKGVGTFMAHFASYSDLPIIYYAHNCFLQIWAEAGIFSLLTFLLFVGLIIYRGIKAFRKNSNFLLLGVTCAVFGYLVNAFLESSLYSLQLAYLFWFMIGLLVALTNLEADPEL